MNFYQILGVPMDADLPAIKKGYRANAISSHPDRNPGDERAAARFTRIHHIYTILSDPVSRRAYDATLLAPAGPGSGRRSSRDEYRAGSRRPGGSRRGPGGSRRGALSRRDRFVEFLSWSFRLATFAVAVSSVYRAVDSYTDPSQSSGRGPRTGVAAGHHRPAPIARTMAEGTRDGDPEPLDADRAAGPPLNVEYPRSPGVGVREEPEVAPGASRPAIVEAGRPFDKNAYNKLIKSSLVIDGESEASFRPPALEIGVNYSIKLPKRHDPLIIKIMRSVDARPIGYQISEGGLRLFGTSLSVRAYDSPDGCRPRTEISPGGMFIEVTGRR